MLSSAIRVVWRLVDDRLRLTECAHALSDIEHGGVDVVVIGAGEVRQGFEVEVVGELKLSLCLVTLAQESDDVRFFGAWGVRVAPGVQGVLAHEFCLGVVASLHEGLCLCQHVAGLAA